MSDLRKKNCTYDTFLCQLFFESSEWRVLYQFWVLFESHLQK